jgi:hypothetical protein
MSISRSEQLLATMRKQSRSTCSWKMRYACSSDSMIKQKLDSHAPQVLRGAAPGASSIRSIRIPRAVRGESRFPLQPSSIRTVRRLHSSPVEHEQRRCRGRIQPVIRTGQLGLGKRRSPSHRKHPAFTTQKPAGFGNRLVIRDLQLQSRVGLRRSEPGMNRTAASGIE